MTTKTIETKDLSGPALNWAVDFALGTRLKAGELSRLKPYTTDWNLLGPISHERRINLSYCEDLRARNRPFCWADMDGRRAHGYAAGHDEPLVAVARCLVAHRLGETVEVPVEVLDLADAPESPASGVFKTVLQFTVLHEDNEYLSNLSLADIAHECMNGEYVGGELKEVSRVPLSEAQLEMEASALGSDAAFFHLSDNLDGNADEVAKPMTSPDRRAGA